MDNRFQKSKIMLLSNFLAVTLISTAIYPNFCAAIDEQKEISDDQKVHNSGWLSLPQSSEEDVFSNDNFFQNSHQSFPSFEKPHRFRHNPSEMGVEGQQQQQPFVMDPVLREIYEEEKRLNLAHDDDFDMRSEEARELISTQRRRLNRMQNLARQTGAAVGIPQMQDPLLPYTPRTDTFQAQDNTNHDDQQRPHSQPTTDYSPPVSTDEKRNAVSLQTITTTSAPRRVGRMGIGGQNFFQKIKTGVDTAVGNFHNKLFGSPEAAIQTTPSPSRIPSNNQINSPDEDNKPSHPTSSNSQIHDDETHRIVEGPLNCTKFQTEYNGTCHNALQQEPCNKTQWLIEDDITRKGKCVENKCAHKPNHAYFDGKCVLARGKGDHCHLGMIAYVFKNGDVECDCQDKFLFHMRDGNCYSAFSRGPCNPGEIFVSKTTQKGTLPASCIKNKCSQEGFFCNAPSCPNNRNCIELGSNCPLGKWIISSETLNPACLEPTVQPIIGNVPTLACAPGSRRDILGTCQPISKPPA